MSRTQDERRRARLQARQVRSEPPEFPPLCDFSYLCQDANRFRTDVWLDQGEHEGYHWLTLGRTSLQKGTGRLKDRWELRAWVGAEKRTRSIPTDFEHDPVYACKLPLIGLTFEAVESHWFKFNAFVDPTAGANRGTGPRFRVPSCDYDPRKHPEARECQEENCISVARKHGGGPHTIVPEFMHRPPFDPELYDMVRGAKVEIWIGPRED